MATKRSQRIGVWFIAIFMLVGSVGTFLIMILSVQNQKIDQVAQKKLSDEYNKVIADYQAKIDKQSKDLSAKYYPELNQYSSRVSEFKTEGIKEVSRVDVKVGTGQELKKGTEYSAYYIGWNPKGVIFDQSIDGKTLKAPIAGGNLIQGWNEGVIGMKVGGVREITIPSEKAYGAKGSGDNIPPNTPLKFIIMVIPKVEEIPVPDLSKYIQQ